MKLCILGISLFISHFFSVFTADLNVKTNDCLANESRTVISDFYYHLSDKAAFILSEDDTTTVSLKEKSSKISFKGQSCEAKYKLSRFNKSLFPGTIHNESFAINHIPYHSALSIMKHCIFGFGQLLI